MQSNQHQCDEFFFHWSQKQQEQQKQEQTKNPVSVVQIMQIDPISLEVGRGLLSLVDPNQGAKLLERVTSIRRHIALEMGIVVPGVRFRDNLQLRPNAYSIKIKDVEVLRPYQDLFEQLKTDRDGLVSYNAGMIVDKLQAAAMQAEQAAVAYRYHLCRNDINAVLPPSRHNGNYCEALGTHAFDKVKEAVNGTSHRWGHGERRVAVNLEHATADLSSRRIEFRQHSGTLNIGKILGWYRLLCEFVKIGRAHV